MEREAIIFSDGSSSPKTKKGGYAALIASSSEPALLVKGSEEQTTSNRMEMMAAIKALETLKTPHVVYLVSDSAYLINTIKNKWYRNWDLGIRSSRKNPDLWNRLIIQLNIHDVNPIHVKGHADNKWNNKADELAVTARVNEVPETVEELNISMEDLIGS